MHVPFKKKIAACFAAWSGAQWFARRVSDVFFDGAIRAIVGHSVPKASTENFRRQLAYYRQHYCDVSQQDLQQFLKSGVWLKPMPGLIISFDDGLRTHAEVVVPLLEEFGFTGWFFLPCDFLDAPVDQQRAFAKQHQIVLAEDLPGPRVAMTWDQARKLSEKHVVGCHTASHCRLSAALTEDQRKQEICSSKSTLEQRLGREVDSFSWVGGERRSYSRACAAEIAQAGYQFSFMTNSAKIGPQTSRLQLDRTHVESHWPLSLVEFQLSGILDLLYLKKRWSVHHETSILE